MPAARFLPLLLLIANFACNRTQQGVSCAPLANVTLIRISESSNTQPRQSEIRDPYRIQALVDFANGRSAGFSARSKGLPAATTSATFYHRSQPLLTFAAGANFFSLSCAGYAGVQEANRVQIAEFERLLNQQP
ncbi:MAG TPA: hypothetical protein VI424_01350 [Terriglobales bacterium]